jgi:3'(2'),5'-bisphosphate nucleotidase
MTAAPADSDRDRIAEIFGRIALAAGRVVMDVYAGAAHARLKPDSSPVCDADEAAEATILAALARELPGMPVVAEEATAKGVAPRCGARFVLVDPLDGTREFLARNGEFTVNLALIENGAPVAGAVYAPAQERLWLGGTTASVCTAAPGAALPAASMRRPILARKAPSEGLAALCSRSHGEAGTEDFLRKLPVVSRINVGSSLKFCLIAEGEADVYPRFGPTMEWDVAAGDAVLRAAGGRMQRPDGTSFVYGKQADGFRNGPFVAWGRAG